MSTPEPLPAASRLLHIGLMKTGTTAVQSVLSQRRRALLRAGVCYPGDRYNHRQAALVLIRRDRSSAPRALDDWDRLMAEVAGRPDHRVVISNELIAGCPDHSVADFLTELGPNTHIVLTVRPYADVLPSIWQQYVKSGYTEDFACFLTVVLADPPPARHLPPQFARHDGGVVVEQWSRLAGAHNLTVVVVDKRRPTRLAEAFAGLLGLPCVLLTGQTSGRTANRSLSAEEAALLLRVNQILRPHDVPEDDLVRILRNGAVHRILEGSASPTPGTTLVLPPWAAARAAEVGQIQAERIARCGVRVIGDVADLGRPSESRVGRWVLPSSVPIETAAQALAGALSGGLHRGSDFGRVRAPRPVAQSVLTTRWLGRLRRAPGHLFRLGRPPGPWL